MIIEPTGDISFELDDGNISVMSSHRGENAPEHRKIHQQIAEDNDGALVFLARNAWHLNKAQEDFPKVKFSKIKE